MSSYDQDTGEDPEKKPLPELEVSPIEQEPAKPRGFFARIRYYEELLDRKLGIESHSLDRVQPENRFKPNPLVMAFMWASATMNLSCFSTGFLGVQFGLSLGETIPIIILASLLGSAVTVRISSLFVCPVFDGVMKHNRPRLTHEIRAGAQLWAPEQDYDKSPFPDTHWASTRRPSSPRSTWSSSWAGRPSPVSRAG